jgi:hypothetical protein
MCQPKTWAISCARWRCPRRRNRGRWTSLQEKLIEIGAKVVSHGRHVTFQMAEVAVSRQMFAEILMLDRPVAGTARASMKGLRGGKALITIGEVRFDGGKATSSSVPRQAILGFRSSRHPSADACCAGGPKSETMALTSRESGDVG